MIICFVLGMVLSGICILKVFKFYSYGLIFLYNVLYVVNVIVFEYLCYMFVNVIEN